MKLIIGLGNPGEKYQETRHNLGWLAIDDLRKGSWGTFSPWKKTAKVRGEISQSEDKKLLLLKPDTFVNESGRAAAAALAFYKLPPENLIVVHDDLDLPVGTFKIQTGRGAAGHHGVESIINSLGAKNFTRLRLGIKPLTPAAAGGKDFVLGKFSKEENALLKEAVPRAIESLMKHL